MSLAQITLKKTGTYIGTTGGIIHARSVEHKEDITTSSQSNALAKCYQKEHF